MARRKKITEDEAAHRYHERLKESVDFYFENEFSVKPRDRILGGTGLVPMWPILPGQKKLHDIVKPMYEAGEGGDVFVFKARKAGFSTYSVGLATHLCLFNPHAKATIVSMDDKSTQTLREIAVTAFDDHTKGIGLPIRVKDNRAEITLTNKSAIDVFTAGKGEVGRGATPYYVLMSEVAFWRNAEQTTLGLTNSAELSSSILVYESTSNGTTGVGEHWYKRYLGIKAGDSGGQYMFSGWFDDPRNVIEPNNREIEFFSAWKELYLAGDTKADTAASILHETVRFTEYEQNLVNEYGVSLPQLKWYYNMLLRRSGTGSEEARLTKRAQEHPSTIEESFTLSGSSTFDQHKLAAMLGKTPEMYFVGDYEPKVLTEGDPTLPVDPDAKFDDAGNLMRPKQHGITNGRTWKHDVLEKLRLVGTQTTRYWQQVDGTIFVIQFAPRPDGPFSLFEQPVDGAKYYAGIDTSAGKEQDATSANILRLDSKDRKLYQVARYNDNSTDPEECAELIFQMLQYFDDPLCCVETNADGRLMVRTLQQLGYTNLYRQERFLATGKRNTSVGWDTLLASRKELVSFTHRLLRPAEPLIVIRDAVTIKQFMGMRRKNGKDEHARLEHDDEWMSFILAAMASRQPGEVAARRIRHDVANKTTLNKKERDLSNIALMGLDRDLGSDF